MNHEDDNDSGCDVGLLHGHGDRELRGQGVSQDSTRRLRGLND